MTYATFNDILLSITAGEQDDSLEEIITAVRNRQQKNGHRKAALLDVGDQFVIEGCSSKYWNGALVKFLGFDGKWLSCEIVYSPDRRLWQGKQVDLAPACVGVIQGKAS